MVSSLSMMHHDLPLRMETCPQGWNATGDRNLFNRIKVAFLLSRQSPTVTPETPWFHALHHVCQNLADAGFVPLVSSQPLYHDIVRACCAAFTPIIEIIDRPEQRLSCTSNRNLSLNPTVCPRDRKSWYAIRDETLVAAADILVLIDIRRKGRMYHLTQRALEDNRPILAVQEGSNTSPILDEFSMKKIGLLSIPMLEVRTRVHTVDDSDECSEIPRPTAVLKDFSGFLWHYTRSHPGPWPGQTWEDYMQCLLTNHPLCRHRAIDSLMTILERKKIAAADFLIRGKYRVVCLTEHSPADLGGITTWAHHLRRWDFQPYGIGIRKEAAQNRGAQPVIYGEPKDFQHLPEHDRFRFQRRQSTSGRKSWASEQEWRIPGDIDLTTIDPLDLRIVVPGQADLKELPPHYRTTIVISDSLAG